MKVCSVCRRCCEDPVLSCAEESHPALSEARGGSCELITGYRLDYLLGSGAKGEVYRARHTASGRSCVIKILSANKDAGEQFLRDAELSATLFHPNVVDVYEAGAFGSGELFVVAEDAGGQTLRELLDAVGLPELLTSIQIVRQVAEALHAIHLKGLIHGAVSPENIVLTTDPEHRPLARIKDADFGGLVQHATVSNKFLIDTALDSLKYFAPEQCSGEAVSMKTDVYGLGIVLYEMLAGAPPFDAPTAAGLVEKQRYQRPPEIRIDNFELRMLVTHALMESLTKWPGNRQSSANVFARQLRHIEQLATHVSTPPPAGAVPPTPKRPGARADVVGGGERPPVARHAAPAADASSAAAAAQFESESRPVRAVVPQISVDDRPQSPNFLSVEPAIEKVVLSQNVRAETRASRLKLRRRKLHLKAAPLLPETIGSNSLPAGRTPKARPIHFVPVEIAAVQAEPEITAVPVQSRPARIECDQTADDIPSVADVLEVVSREQMSEILPEPQAITAASVEREVAITVPPMPKAVLKEIPAARRGPEVITAVSARKAPRADVRSERPRVPQKRAPAAKALSRASREIAFFPTLLGDAEKRETVDADARGSMFSAYYASPSRRGFAVPYRSLMIGGGFLALVALFLFGGDSLLRNVSTGSAGEPVAAQAAPAKETLRPASWTGTASPSKKKALKYFEKPQPQDANAAGNRLQPAPAKERNPFSGERRRASAGHDFGMSPPLSSRPVTSPDNGKKGAKTGPEKNSANKKPLSAADKTVYGARPRIVKNPKP